MFWTNILENFYSTGTDLVDFMCLTQQTGNGRQRPYNVQLTVVNNNNKKKNFLSTRAAVNTLIVI